MGLINNPVAAQLKPGVALVSTLLFALFLLSGPADVVGGDRREGGEGWTVGDLVGLERAVEFDISPCGRRILWVKLHPDKKRNRIDSDLYLSILDGEPSVVQLTRGKWLDRLPRWSPDGRFIAFISDRYQGKAKQVWIMDARGGEPRQVTKMKQGIKSFAWRGNREIVFAAREDSTLREIELAKSKDDTEVVGDEEHYTPVRLFQVNIDTGEIKRLTTNEGQVVEFKVSPDGRWIVANINQSVHYEYDNRVPPKQFLFDLETGGCREIFTDPFVDPFGYAWDFDSSGFYCTRSLASDSTDTYVGVPALYHYDLTSSKLSKVELNWPRELGNFYHPLKNGVLVSLADGVYNRLAVFTRGGDKWRRTWLHEDYGRNLDIWDVGPDGETVVFSRSTASSPPHYYVGKLGINRINKRREILKVNSHLIGKPFARREVIRWVGARGDSVEGILFYPQGYNKRKRCPLVVSVHGGPSSVDRDVFGDGWVKYPNLLVSRGAFVLLVNYHGSSNYGLDWVESIRGHYYDYPVNDILRGVDFLIERGLVDPERLGIMGWSNGSILSIRCCLETSRFKVLCAGAGDVNWTSDYGNCVFGAAFDNAYFGGPPWKLPQKYLELSPLFQLEKMRTPTIIFFGTQDRTVPTEQGWQHYRALQQIGTVPVRFLLFPGAKHGLEKLSHRRRKITEELSWLDKYLFSRKVSVEEVVRNGSPLDLVLKKEGVKRVGELYGESVAGILVPEVVSAGSIMVSRFEITRAQYQVFDEKYTYEPGTGNYPVSGISFAEVKEYCSWLSRKTGWHFQPVREREMRLLLEKVGSNLSRENNLDYWAGYSPTPEEVKLLLEKIEKTGKSLVLEVGTMAPLKEYGVYDLGGNVAEWCLGNGGKGVVMGLSAVSPADPKFHYTVPPKEYVGFRVCRDLR